MVTVGNTLTATPASVTGDPTPVRSWQWLRNGATISGATASSYVAVGADAGSQLSVRQIETNIAGVAVATSAATTTVQAFDPATLFASSEVGAWYDPSDSSTVWQDAAGTIPAGNGDPVGRIDDKSGNGNHATQTTSAARPVLTQSGSLWYLDFDGVDDYLDVSWGTSLAQPNSFGVAAALITNSNRFHIDGYSSGRNTLYNPGGSTGITLYTNSAVIYDYSANDALRHVWAGEWNGASSYLRKDGALLTPVSGTTVGTLASDGMTICASNSKAGWASDDVYALVFVDRTLTSAETLGLESYLANKSGVTL